MRSRLRSELKNLTETNSLLTKIAFLFSQKASRVEFEIAGSRFSAAACTNVVIDPTLGSANIQFQRAPFSSTAATATIQSLTYTAGAAGAAGNSITVTYTTGATAGSEVVTVVGNAISVQIASGTSTATQIKAAVDASSAAHALVSVAILSGQGSTAQTAPVTATALSGGVTASAVENYDTADIRMIRRLRNKKYMIELTDTANPA